MQLKFSEHLKRIRKTWRYTQQDLANELNISVQSISKWEKGAALPSIEFLPKLAECFDCTVNTFFSEYELQIYEQFPPIEEDELVCLYEILLKQQGVLKDERENSPIPESESEPHESVPVEAMFLPEVYQLLNKLDYISMAKLQHHLNIGFGLAHRLFDALINMGIVSNRHQPDGHAIIKEKVDLLLPYIEEKNK